MTGSTGTVPASNYYTAKYAAADGALLWQRTYNGPANGTDRAQALAIDSEGNVIVTGSSVNGGAGDFYTAKYAAADGALVWERRYNGPANGADGAEAVAVDRDGNVVVTGSSANGSSDYYTAKYAAADGALLWEKRYNGFGNDVDAGHSVAVDAAGYVVVTGYSSGGGTNQDIYTAKYAGTDGALVWEQRYDRNFSFDEAWLVGVDANGDVFITAHSNNDFYTAKYASTTGAVLWEQRYHHPANSGARPSSLSVGALGDVFVTGTVRGASGYDDIYTAKYSGATGVVLWEAIYDGPTHLTDTMHLVTPYAGKIVATPDGGAVVICQSATSTFPDNYDFATIQYSPPDTDGDGIPDDWETATSTDEDTARTVVLRGWFEYGGALSFDVLTPPEHGILSGIAPNLTYTPDLNFNGPDSFTYIVDYAQASHEGAVSITVNPVDDAPIATGRSVTTDEDTAIAVGLRGADADGDPLTFVITSAPTHGTLSGVVPNLTYNPSTNYSGPDSFGFKVHDNAMESAPASMFVNVIPVNDAPVASPQSVTTNEDVAAAIVLGSSDIDSSSLTHSIVTAPAHGTLFGGAPNVTYTPAVNYSGPDGFSFKVNDGLADSALANVSIMVTPVNDAPVASPQAVSTNEDVAAAIVLGCSDADSSSLTYSVVTVPAHGTLSGSAPNVTYTPAVNYSGPDGFSFKVNDGLADSAPANVSIMVTPVNDAPIAWPQAVSTNEDVAAAIVLGSSDIDSSSLTYSTVTAPAHGTLSGSAPNVTYTPAVNYSGPDGFSFKVNDGLADSALANVSITVTPVNDAPVASPQSVTANEDVAAAIVLGSSDIDSGSLTYSVVTAPAHGTLSGGAPNVTYTPAVNYSGPDGFSFKVNDGLADSAPANVSIMVTPINDAPIASPQAVSTNEDTPKAIILSGSDPEGAALSYSVVTVPTHGTLSGTVPNVTYTPNANYFGSDSFTFRVNDGSIESGSATVTITAASANDVPVAVNDVATTAKSAAVNVNVLANDSDVDGDALTVTSTTQGVGGSTAIINGGTAIRFTPNLNYVGNGVFTYTLQDGRGGSATATVQISVTKK